MEQQDMSNNTLTKTGTIDALMECHWLIGISQKPTGNALIFYDDPAVNPRFIYRMITASTPRQKENSFFIRGKPTNELRQEYTCADRRGYDVIKVPLLIGNIDEYHDLAMDKIVEAYCALCNAHWKIEHARRKPVAKK